ncbi:MAG: SDR family NAD(P)-dependent oxidoreductase [Pseudomonadales bacterium]|nr:SDR family NAD(P)-dependent oxidoreductase [Pseudomonadales bacterium]
MELDNKVCVITGGASGIGAATSRAFAAKGARVVVTDINMEGARQVAEEIGGHAITCDVSVEAEVNNLVAETEEQLGPIDLFFNNAAVATGGNPLNTPIDVWQDQWNINVMAHVYAVRAVLPGMLARGQGYLLHTASMAGILTSQGNLTYATTKHAVVGLAEWLSITYHDQGIRVSLLAPLGVRTPMLGDLSSPFAVSAAGPIKEPKDVADMVVSGIQSESFLILTDPIAQTWMERKTNDPERWLTGMRRLQAKMNSAPNA